MANSFITLNSGSGGPQLDTELLTVAAQQVHRERNQVAGALDVEIATVNAVPPATSEHGLSSRKLVNRSTVQSFHAAAILNVTTSINGSSFDCSPYTKALVYIDATISAGAPTELRVRAQFSDDAGTTWFNIDEAPWADLTFAAGVFPVLLSKPLIPMGRLVRFRIEGTGTDGSNTITVSIDAEFYS